MDLPGQQVSGGKEKLSGSIFLGVGLLWIRSGFGRGMIGNCARTQDERGKREAQPALGATGQPEKHGRVATWTKGEKSVEPFGPKGAIFTKQPPLGASSYHPLCGWYLISDG